jgi:anaerobic ribonucleoside-triphosphate reductase activating protein
LRIAGIRKTSLFDGIGVNYVIFVQGCPHGCPDCQNPSTHDKDGGYEVSLNELKADIESNDLITGVTFSGGEPMCQFNEVTMLAHWAKIKGLMTTMYTGYTVTRNAAYNDVTIRQTVYSQYRLRNFDYIIDGRFDIRKKSVDIPFRGSSNQRILQRGVDY